MQNTRNCNCQGKSEYQSRQEKNGEIVVKFRLEILMKCGEKCVQWYTVNKKPTAGFKNIQDVYELREA